MTASDPDICTDLFYYIVGDNEVIIDEKLVNYIDEFAYILTSILKKGRKKPKINDFSKYLKAESKDEVQQWAVSVYNLLRKRASFVEWSKEETLKLESCLYRLISVSVFNEHIKNKKSCIKAAKVRHKEDILLRDFVNNLRQDKYRTPKEFMNNHIEQIIEFIKENCPNIYEKYREDNSFINQRINVIFYRKK